MEFDGDNDTCTTGIGNILRFDKCGGVYVIFAVIIAIIFVYWFTVTWVLKKDMVTTDPMNRKAFTFDVFPGCCSWWPVSHFILFFIIGLLYPNCGVVAMSGAVAWEVFETIMGSITPKDKVSATTNSIEYTQWWGGQLRDIAFDAAGFFSGKLIRMIIG